LCGHPLSASRSADHTRFWDEPHEEFALRGRLGFPNRAYRCRRGATEEPSFVGGGCRVRV
jgi:hypothetical protein